jgi:penicillin-binding protein 1B
VGLRALLLIVVAGVGTMAWLDVHVRSQFDGKRWMLPAQIYARPLELYPGQSLTKQELLRELRVAGYHESKGAQRPGSYAPQSDGVLLNSRAFAYWDGREPNRRVEIVFRGNSVASLKSNGHVLALHRVSPALIGKVYPGHREDRLLISLDDAPSYLVPILLAVEDRRFFEHWGVSWRGVLRATWANLRAGRAIQGASTITQQLAKNFFLTPERTWWRKLRELAITVILEARYSKNDILQAYINEVYLGQAGGHAVHGFGRAAWFYFGRRVDELSVNEVALLVGMIRGPSAYEPRSRPERALQRRNTVLTQLVDVGALSSRQAKALARAPLGVSRSRPKARSPYPAFVELVRHQLASEYPEEALRNEGLRIFTTLAPDIQHAAEIALSKTLRDLSAPTRVAREARQGAFVAVEPSTGAVLALVADRDPARLGFNRALKARRPVGSIVKPVVYLAALQSDSSLNLATPVLDAPVAVSIKGQPDWQPKNYNDRYRGEMPLYRALAKSSNVAAVRVGTRIGVQRVSDLLQNMGLARAPEPYPALLLGAMNATPFEVAQIYQPMANQGFAVPLRAIREVTDKDGTPLSRYPVRIRRVADEGNVYLLRAALGATFSEGTARSAPAAIRDSGRWAGKTGTTNDLRDSWFAGFSDEVLAVAWVGRDDNVPVGLSGSSGALKVWSRFVNNIGPRYNREDQTPVPEGVTWHWTQLSQGVVTQSQCPDGVRLPYLDNRMPAFGHCFHNPTSPSLGEHGGEASRGSGHQPDSVVAGK